MEKQSTSGNNTASLHMDSDHASDSGDFILQLSKKNKKKSMQKKTTPTSTDTDIQAPKDNLLQVDKAKNKLHSIYNIKTQSDKGRNTPPPINIWYQDPKDTVNLLTKELKIPNFMLKNLVIISM